MEKSIDSQAYIHLRNWLIKGRTDCKGLTVRELAEKLDEHYSLVNKVEVGRRKLDIVEFVQYCEALDIAPEDGIKVIQANLKLSSTGSY